VTPPPMIAGATPPDVSLLDVKPLGSVELIGSLNTYAYRFCPWLQYGACMIGSAVVNLPASGS
jgi:hypothetical protein